MDVHGETDDHVGGVEEADVAGVYSALGRHPRDRDEEEVDGHRECDDEVPCDEFTARRTEGCAALADEPYA